MEGDGRSDKGRHINTDIAAGADDLAAVQYVGRTLGIQAMLVCGIFSGASRAALFGRRSPARVKRPALDAFAWTG